MLTKLSTLRLLTIFLICAVVAMWLATACADDSGEVDPEVEERGMTAENLDEANEPSVVTPEVKETEDNDPAKVSPEAAEKDMATESLNEVNQPSVVTPEVKEKEANDLSKVSPKDAEKDMTAENLDEANEPSVVTPEATPEVAEKDMTTESLNEPNTPSPVSPEIVENEVNDPCEIDPVLTGRKGMISRNIHEDVARAKAIRHKYEDLFWRQPNVHATGIGNLKGKYGEYLDIWGFSIEVTKKVDQNTLPPEDRIPDCLEGVPVQIEETPMEELL